MEKTTVEVLLATYNGEKFLSAQIDSILSQTFKDVRILIRDDGSTDNTLMILKSYQDRFPEKIKLLDIPSSQRGPTYNFSTLIENSSSPYLLLSDQDDIWLPPKIDVSLEMLRHLEDETSTTFPLLVHTDLKVVQQNLNEISPSFISFSGLNPSRNKFNNLLMQNTITGCTTIFNRSLANLAAPIPHNAQMHDWWMALTASVFGKIGYVNEATVLYRQHEDNTLGATGFNISNVYTKASKMMSESRDDLLAKNFLHAAAFKAKFGDQLPEDHLLRLNAFLNLKSQGFITKRYSLLKWGFLKGKLAQNLGIFLRL